MCVPVWGVRGEPAQCGSLLCLLHVALGRSILHHTLHSTPSESVSTMSTSCQLVWPHDHILFPLLSPVSRGEAGQMSFRVTFSIAPYCCPFLSTFLPPLPSLDLFSHNLPILAVVFLISLSLIFFYGKQPVIIIVGRIGEICSLPNMMQMQETLTGSTFDHLFSFFCYL